MRLLTRSAWGAIGLLMLALAAYGPSNAAPADDDRAATEQPATDHSAIDHSAIDHPALAHSAASHPDLEADAATDFSVYHAESVWTDQTGAERPLSSLAGRVQLVAMVYTNCAYACPRIMLDLKRIAGELGPVLADDVGFVIVSIDPERDTPERLAAFASGSRLDTARWTLLTADEGDILELAALLGVQYRETRPGEWVHSNLITVLDRDGEVAHRQMGLGTDPAETLAVIRGLTS